MTVGSVFSEKKNPVVSLIIGIFGLAWSLWVLSPFWQTLVPIGPTAFLCKYGGDLTWGSILFTISAGIVIGSLTNMMKLWSNSLMIFTLFWVALAMAYGIGSWQSTGWIASTFIATCSAFTYLKVRFYEKDK